MAINSEYLAVLAIFTAGIYVGMKIKAGFAELKAHLDKKREKQN
jgi:hypothetical protein